MSSRTTAIDREFELYQYYASQWWNNANANILHKMNSTRIPFLKQCLLSHGIISADTAAKDKYLTGLKIIDVGCGGEFVSEPLARAGAEVVGLDFCPGLIKVAEDHAKDQAELANNLKYVCNTIENVCDEYNEAFDIVVAFEVLDHIQNVPLFIESCVKILKPGGSMFFSTINRTTKSWMVAIILYEYVLNIITRGSHHWDQFVKPEEIELELKKYNCEMKSVKGSSYSLFRKEWSEVDDISVFFHVHAVKKALINEMLTSD